MNISVEVNPLLEVLIMLDRVNRECDVGHTKEKIGPRYGNDVGEKIYELIKPLIMIQNKVISSLPVEKERLKYLFGRTGVLSKENPIGCSPASMILAKQVFAGVTSVSDISEKIGCLSMDEKIECVSQIVCMECMEDSENEKPTLQEFLNHINRLSIDSDQKWKIVDTLMNFDAYAKELCSIMSIAENVLMNNISLAKDLIAASSAEFKNSVNARDKVESMTHFSIDEKDAIRPCLFAPECAMVISFETNNIKQKIIYIGVTMSLTHSMPLSEFDSLDLVEKTKVLADRNRLDILSYIKNKPAYGQEIADQFKLYSTTISHHMSRLVGSGFVLSSTKGTKTIYNIDRESIDEFIKRLHRFLLD